MALVVPHAQLSYTGMFNADELIVEFDGATYTLANNGNGEYGAGAAPSSTNPIGIRYANGVNTMFIDGSFSDGDHHVVIKSKSSSVETTECFKKAVKSVSGGGVMMLNLIEDDNKTFSVEGATWQEAYDALTNGAMVYLSGYGFIFPCVSFSNTDIVFSQISVENAVYVDMYIWQSDGSVINDSNSYPPQSGN